MLSPHVYGPAVTSAPTAWAGPDLYARLTASFGYAMQQGQQLSILFQPCRLLPAANVQLKVPPKRSSADVNM